MAYQDLHWQGRPCPACRGRDLVKAVINDYISRELVQDAAQMPSANAAPLLERCVLDSLSLPRPMIFVQGRSGS